MITYIKYRIQKIIKNGVDSIQVSGKWIKDNVAKLWAPFPLESLEEYIDLDIRYQTTLSYKGIKEVEKGMYEKRFAIIFPGHGVFSARGPEY